MTAPKWLANYDDGVPSSSEPYPSRSLTDYLRTSAARWPDRPALLFKGSTISYRKLEEQSSALAAAFVRNWREARRPGRNLSSQLPAIPS